MAGTARFGSTVPMNKFTAEDGCPAWRAQVVFDPAEIGWRYQWGVVLDGSLIRNVWGIATEISAPHSESQQREFCLEGEGQLERVLVHPMFATWAANKHFLKGEGKKPGIRFSVWGAECEECFGGQGGRFRPDTSAPRVRAG